MGIRVVGAGLGRTGTHSLKIALEQLLGGACYHMIEVIGHPDHMGVWQAAIDGQDPDWGHFLEGYAATVDWPAAAFWRPISEQWPGAVILLSTRKDSASWWKSANETIFEATARGDAEAGDAMGGEFLSMTTAMLRDRFTPQWQEEEPARAAYEAHNADVRATAPAGRLVEWQPGDGWAPICAALELPVPAEPFPHVNSTAEFRMMVGLDHDAPAGPSS